MTVNLYVGHVGTGKSLTMIKDALIYHHQGRKIYRNFKGCKFGEYISNVKISALNKHSEIRDCVLLIDETQINFDSRRHYSPSNKNFSNFVQQIRKRRMILLLATQFANTIDLRIRQHVNYLVFPNFIEHLDVCEVTYLDMRSIGSMYDNPRQVKTVYEAQPLFSVFDSYEEFT